MKNLFAMIALCFVCALALVGCNVPKDFTPKESDFEVSLEVEKAEISAGEKLCFTIRFKNNSGYALKDVTHGGVFLRYSLTDGTRSFSPAYADDAIVETLTKEERLLAVKRDTAEIPAGKYSLTGYAEFTYHGSNYKISSPVVYETTIL